MSISVIQVDGKISELRTVQRAPRVALAQLPAVFSEKRMLKDIKVLASDKMAGRGLGTPALDEAANYIAEEFKKAGLQPGGDGNSYFQTWTENAGLPMGKIQLKNVIGILPGKKVQWREQSVVVAAHYDHLGRGWPDVHKGDEGKIHYGADDNASGVAAMLYLVKELQGVNTNNNYLFIAFSGEEMGLLGSNYFVKNPTVDLEKVNYMLNMDMVGRLNDENTIAVHGVGTSPIFKQVLFANKGNLVVKEHESGVGPSDQTSFYLMDIPVLHFFTGQHEDYHKPSDDAEKLNYEGMASITSFIESVITDLDNDGKLAFRKTKNESEEVPAFKVTLGVVPDYLFNGKGMRIDGVSEDKPAQKAGMQKGDIVVKMGEYEVIDMMSYMKSLGKFEKGTSTKVTINRNDELIELDVTF